MFLTIFLLALLAVVFILVDAVLEILASQE